jgi:hypothetical protein
LYGYNLYSYGYNRVVLTSYVQPPTHRIGDYPGLGEATSMAHAGTHDCHWCEGHFPWSHAMRRHDHRCARRFLREGHPFRRGGVWGDEELRPEPRTRTHESIIAAGVAAGASELEWDDRAHPRKATGVDGECPLSKIPLFDMVWDVCMDFMHIVKVLVSGHLLPLLKGKRKLKDPQVKANLEGDPDVARSSLARPCLSF